MQPNVIEGFRLSPQQKRLWTLQQTAPGTYFVQGSVDIAGPLDDERLQTAMQQVVARHEILRTSFQCLPGMNIPVQVIAEDVALPIALHDLSAAAATEQAAAIEALLDEMRQPPADAEPETLVRLALVALAPQQHTLLISVPALCGDPATLKNIVQELGSAYTADPDTEQPDAPMQYADFAEWQHNLLEEESDESSSAAWSQLDFAGLSSFRLPLEQPAADAPFEPQVLPLPLQPESAARLARFAQEHQQPAALCLLTCYYGLLWGLTHQPEIIVGVGYPGRTYEDLQGAMGLFAKFVPVRAQLDAQVAFDTLLGQVAEAVGEAADWQDDFFWERVAPASGSADTTRFFPISFEFEELPAPYAAGDTLFSLRRYASSIDRFKVKLVCVKRQDDLDLTLHYDSTLFSHGTIERLARMFQSLVEQAISQPERPLAALTLLNDDQRELLLHTLNATKAEYPTDRCFHDLFAEQVERTPDRIAISFEDQRLTYVELNARANQLAHYLHNLNGGGFSRREARVGVYLTRSPDLLVAILGVFKAGGVYLPLDPSFPQPHLAMILADAQVDAIITQESLSFNLPEQSYAVVQLDQAWPTIAQESRSNPDVATASGSAAYVIYTSGSTGHPKGVVIEHRSLVNYLCWVNQRLLDGQECNLPVVTRLTFDASLKQLFAPLLRGAEVWLLTDEVVNEPETLLQNLTTRTNVALNCVPSLWTTLLDIASEQQIAQLDQHLTRLFVGGEQLTPELVTRSFALLPRLQIWNLYGPTETTANASAAMITPASAITIGRPIANTRIYLLDSYLQPVPIGVVGDLYVGGISIARGYLNQPDLTAEKFVPDPFGDTPGGRLYRTGDRARYTEDGSIEFQGRSDYQIKLRGLRIELGAIEAALNRHPSVRESVVVVRDDNLVAYVVENKDQRNGEDLTTDLRSFLQTQIPGYMIPALIVALDGFPRASSGKLDRAALPAPDAARPRRTADLVAPRDAIEAALAAIWCEVLDLDEVGVHDNFFDLGGHSLLATRLVSRIRKIFRVELPLRALFEVATIAEVAQMLVAHEAKPGQIAKIARVLQQIKTMSAAEVAEAVQNKRPANGQ